MFNLKRRKIRLHNAILRQLRSKETRRERERGGIRESIGGRIIWEEKEFVIRVYLYMNMIINGESGISTNISKYW
jgi:hypothetical protein